jgi:hypothetical protein
LKGTFADLSRGFFRVFGQTKVTILLGFTVAGPEPAWRTTTGALRHDGYGEGFEAKCDTPGLGQDQAASAAPRYRASS